MNKIQAAMHQLRNFAPKNAVIDLLKIDESIGNNTSPNPLQGMPFAVKNNICVKGARLTCGSRMLEGYISPYSAHVIDRMTAAGAVPVCTANMDEFGMGSTGELSAFGTPENPAAHGFCPGGSSSGSATLVASGCVPLALASDTGGSARLPAAHCGVIGMKPSYGAFSRYGLTAYASSLEQIGLIGRDISVIRAAHRCLAQAKDPRDATHRPFPPLRESFLSDKRKIACLAMDSLSIAPAIQSGLEDARKRFERQGYSSVSCVFPDPVQISAAYYTIACAEASANLARFTPLMVGKEMPGNSWEEKFAACRSLMGKEVQKRINLGAFVLRESNYHHYYLRAQAFRNRLRQWFDDIFSRCGLMLLPVSLQTASPLGETLRDSLFHYYSDHLTACANLAGLPAISLPMGKDNVGRPFSIQLIAPFGRDEWLFDAAELLINETRQESWSM